MLVQRAVYENGARGILEYVVNSTHKVIFAAWALLLERLAYWQTRTHLFVQNWAQLNQVLKQPVPICHSSINLPPLKLLGTV